MDTLSHKEEEELLRSTKKPKKVETQALPGDKAIWLIFVIKSLEGTLQKRISVEGKKQLIIYDGIEKLCFECGRMGHKQEIFPNSTPTIITVKSKMVAVEDGKPPSNKTIN
ncbi:hypothetical protein Golob_015707 [Gossypium lobatum]|uniref:Zinc knuckle CX2CX4HX4C domain-containing protein n=1 Tax=Gossypium lobatum TaxID=34289 RepID=A0A7J8M249_9ROSI|nr:hypothetical protein [Gossypium lobatum]